MRTPQVIHAMRDNDVALHYPLLKISMHICVAIAQLIRHALIDLEFGRTGWFKPGGRSVLKLSENIVFRLSYATFSVDFSLFS